MAIDTPARLAILGAGPIGLEAALYARFLGYDVVVYERGDVAASVRQWGHVRLFTPFRLNRSPLGLAAIEAQDETYQPPADDAIVTGQEWIDRYLLPLAQTDLVGDCLRTQTSVVAVGKEELLKGDMPGHEDRGDWSFRVLSRNGKPLLMSDVLAAMIKAHEIQGVIALENSFNKVGLDHVIRVKVASTAVVAHLHRRRHRRIGRLPHDGASHRRTRESAFLTEC